MVNVLEVIQDDLNQALETDKLDLPVLPEVALAIRDATADPKTNASNLAAVISQDAGVAGQLIKVANSSMYRGAQEIEHLPMAISRIGLLNAANIATGLAMKQMFDSTSPGVEAILRDSWKRATDIAGFASVNAKFFTKLKPDQATLAGLTHNVGILPILKFAGEHPKLLEDKNLLNKVIEKLHPTLGLQILEAWEFPREIREVPACYLRFDRNTEETTYSDVVQVAYLQRLKGTEHPHGQLDCSKLPSFQKLGLDDVEELEDDLSEQMMAATEVLYT